MRSNGKSTILGMVASIGLLLFSGGPADGALTLSFSNGSSTVSIVDGGAGDLSSEEGVITYAGVHFGANLDLTVGRSFPEIGSAYNPTLDLQSVHIEFFSPSTVFQIALTEDEFLGAPSDPATFITSVEGFATNNAGVQLESYLGGNLISSLGTSSDPLTGAFDETDEQTQALPKPPFSASLVATITSSPFSLDVVSFSGQLQTQSGRLEPMPEPAAVLIWAGGMALFGAVGAGRRFRRKSVAAN